MDCFDKVVKWSVLVLIIFKVFEYINNQKANQSQGKVINIDSWNLSNGKDQISIQKVPIQKFDFFGLETDSLWFHYRTMFEILETSIPGF